jgi:hypothetical protein
MKNIHILKTDKPSRLFEILQFNFVFDNQNKYSEEYKKLHKYKNQNIYITSDEEIKKKNFIYDTEDEEVCFVRDKYYLFKLSRLTKNRCKKIVLTTDQNLIKNGVQAIPDEFLKWFVKNPSCEYVEVTTFFSDINYPYEIIIPQEEPNSIKQMEDRIKGINVDTGFRLEEPKQEIFNEIGNHQQELFSYLHNELGVLPLQSQMHDIEIIVLKMQDETMYSEEEVIELLNKREDYINQTSSIFDYITAKEWFEQFKKQKNENF